MQIPVDMLKPDVLHALIEAFILQEGTDYGEQEISLEEKVAQVKKHLLQGEADIVFDEETETCHIVVKQKKYK